MKRVFDSARGGGGHIQGCTTGTAFEIVVPFVSGSDITTVD